MGKVKKIVKTVAKKAGKEAVKVAVIVLAKEIGVNTAPPIIKN